MSTKSYNTERGGREGCLVVVWKLKKVYYWTIYPNGTDHVFVLLLLFCGLLLYYLKHPK